MDDPLMRSLMNGVPRQLANRASLNKRLQELKAKTVVRSFRIVCVDDINQAAKVKMRPADLDILQQAAICKPEDLASAQRAVWNRWQAARAEAIQEVRAGAAFVVVLSDDVREDYGGPECARREPRAGCR
jgi:hypothetical protein